MKLFEPLKIRGMTLKNRTYMLSMGIPGQVGDVALDYWVARAKGGVAAITTGIVSTWAPLLDGIEDKRPLTEAVHKAAPDCTLAMQPMPSDSRDGKEWSPSGTPYPGTYLSIANTLVIPMPLPKIEFIAMTKDDIKWYIESMAESARRQIQVGFDYIELHATHAYLFRQFLSPLDNKREDEYGGSLENRMRFPLETVMAVRDAVGNDFPIFFKMPALEPEDRGITKDEAARFAMELEKAGADVLIVTQGTTTHARGYMNTVCPVYNYLPMGSFQDYAAFIKGFVNIPVAAVGRINKPELAEAILLAGKADIIGIGRQLIADPDWPNKAASGAWGNIRPCLACNACIDPTTYLWLAAPEGQPGAPLPCTVNARSCREVANQVVPTQSPKKVMVVGGGPGGMEAARIAADRGHDVTLYERQESLGGALLAAAMAPNKEQHEDFRQYLTVELARTGVRVRLGEAVDAATVDREKPDAVVVATGARPRSLDIPGAAGKNLPTADDVLTGKAQVGHKVLVVGGGLVGLETAEFLTAQGKAVILVEILGELGTDIYSVLRPAVVQKVREAGVVTYVNSQPREMTEEGIRLDIAGTTELMKVDSVVLAVGRESDKALWEQLQGRVTEVHGIGDSVSPRTIRDAIHDGHRVGRTL
jgi:2,4-dienoyl-CoA reductase-like NADH-dependent reductase (Old Yellow Enzyme family)/thioredoxin reductase